ncbi:uncharacterized protein EAE98_010944 [Botrytis deweyae]|uniref:VOC domain-containing protein n=2 Tax=Botrytis TaxID=33196 RepID=A0A4Z1JWL6_9HELO|nr:uncharacterized protein EAE98_010944 [Botrytis deweyae]KAF7915864.1 hypothetical protein EAE98_010944 [Botrytis deweyae]KAF7923644.1 hypothetical protein EAE99_006903 [Botrytis elliptica]TGO73553.1 hypothetical protein BELL_0351g00030 [Botrytis elliptica]
MFRQFIVLCSLPILLACNVDHSRYKRNTNSSGSYPDFILGTDGPADAATLGYTINHHALIVSNLTSTLEFYGDVLGMRHIFTFQLNANWSLMFMGHAQGGKNGTGFQDATTLEMERGNREGLLEFLSYAGTAPPTQTKPHSSFSHLGLIVPDIQAAQARMEAKGVKIVKRVGDAVDINSPIPAALGFPNVQAFEEGIPGLEALGFYDFMIIADPDGNLLEVIQQY